MFKPFMKHCQDIFFFYIFTSHSDSEITITDLHQLHTYVIAIYPVNLYIYQRIFLFQAS